MEHEAPVAAPPAPAKVPAPAPVVVATPEAVGGAPMGVDQVLSLQRTAGNRAVCRAIASGLIQRDDAQPAGATDITDVNVTPGKSSVPTEAGKTIQAKPVPAGASGVDWSLEASSAAIGAGTSIDASSGKVTLGDKQPGGKLKAKGKQAGGAEAWAEFTLVEKPTAIASTTGAASGDYEGAFTHTFTGNAGAGGKGLDGANVNEKFDSQTATSPFTGGSFTLQANAAGSHGWDLDSSGAMTGTDNVSIDHTKVDAQPFVKSASNPTPSKTLPQGFTMTQKLHNKTFPSGSLEATPFATPDHVRTLDEKGGKLVFVIKAGAKDVSMPYTGPAVYRNAQASPASVAASGPKPAKGDWQRNTAQVTVSAEGSGASASYSFAGDALGCEVDMNGKVKIGDKAGTITVRAGEAKRYDEVTITITAAPAATAKPTAAGDEAAGAAPMAAAGEPEP